MAEKYNKNGNDMKKGWNHALSPMIRKLPISDLEKECLQGICMFGKLIFWKGKSLAGFPKSLKAQLGYVPSKEDIMTSLKELGNTGYAKFMDGDTDNRGQVTMHFSPDKFKIKKDGGLDSGNMSELFPA